MNNLREEILRLNVKELETRVANIMLEINILLSKPESFTELVNTLADLTTKLSIAENALNQAKSFYEQTVGEKIDMISKLANYKKEKE